MTAPILGLSTAITVKRALFQRFAAEADGGVLTDLSVSYEFDGAAGRRALYGGGWRGTTAPVIAEEYGSLYSEIVAVPFYIRVKGELPGTSVETTDAEAEQIALTLAQIMARNPRLAGGLTWLGIASSAGTYSRDNLETITTAGYQAQIQAMGSWGP